MKNQRTGRRDRERGSLRVAERDPLRHELADHDVQVGDDQQREDHGEERRHPGSKRFESTCSPSAPMPARRS